MIDLGNVRRGSLFLIDLSRGGGRLLKRCPVLVVQNDVANRYSPETIVAAIRDLHTGRMLPVFVRVNKGSGGLQKDSVIDAGHINTVSKDSLIHFLGRVPDHVMAEVDRVLCLSLGIPMD